MAGRYPGPGYNEATGSGNPKKKASTSYSPAPMSAAAKAKAAARGKATAAKTTARGPKAGTTTVAAVARRFGVTVREARDIAKALKNVAESGKSALNLDRTGNQYLGRQAVRETGKDLAKQVRETVRAAKSGQSGSRAGRISYNADTGTPQGLEAPPRPKYGYSGKGPYKTGKKNK